MYPIPGCPLTSKLLELLQACVDHETGDPQVLSRVAGRTLGTIRTQLNRIHGKLELDSTLAAVVYCLRRGWINLTPIQTE